MRISEEDWDLAESLIAEARTRLIEITSDDPPTPETVDWWVEGWIHRAGKFLLIEESEDN